MRTLTSYELDLVAGGNGTTDDMQVNGVGGPYGDGFGGSGGGGGYGGGGGGYWMWYAPASYLGGYAPGGDGTWHWISNGSGGSSASGSSGSGGDPSAQNGLELKGRDCPTEQSAARDAMSELYSGSQTAKALIDAAAAKGVGLELIKTDITAIAGTPHDRFDWDITHNIQWDPFVEIKGTNSDGSTYYTSPIMALAHELVHAGHLGEAQWQGDASEAAVMAVANQIAREMNASTGSTYDTSRDNHVRTSEYYVSSTHGSIIMAPTRPGCN